MTEQSLVVLPAAERAIAERLAIWGMDAQVERYRQMLPAVFRRPTNRSDAALGDAAAELPAAEEIYDAEELPLIQLLRAFAVLFEPIEQWLAQTDASLDPRYATDHMLRFLADWVALDADTVGAMAMKDMQRLRKLVPAAFPAYRRRGTHDGLQALLRALLPEYPVVITPLTSRDFILGAGHNSRIGRGIALGKGNTPHEFTVEIRTPDGTLPEAIEEAVCELLDAEKPAHTRYRLRIKRSS